MIADSIFDPYNVPLEGKNIVEASAGTGKTYSITILVLRLLLEKNIPIQEILVVTFTNAATKELELRIYQFIRNAYHIATGKNMSQSEDKTLTQLVNKNPNAKEILSDALLFMDELNVMTIHSFCQKTLNEYPLETNQVFDVEINNDIDDLIEVKIRHFWRKEITTLPPHIAMILRETGYDISKWIEVAKSILQGSTPSPCDMPDFEQIKQTKESLSIDRMESFTTEHFPLMISQLSPQEINRRTNLGKAIANEDEVLFINALKEILKKNEEINKAMDWKHVQAYSPLKNFLTEYQQNLSRWYQLKSALLNAILYKLYSEVIPEIEKEKKRRGQLVFADLVNNLHQALTQNKNASFLSEALSNKYRAVFIDEFQDTDKKQYEIFKNAFHKSDLPIFYIGDPKQLIYAWRGADINSYLQAKSDMDRIYSMDKNYRSRTEFLDSFNRYFSTGKDPGGDKNPFYSTGIKFIEVKAGRQGFDILEVNDEPLPGLVMIEQGKNQDIVIDNTAREILHLLEKGKFVTGKEQRKIKPEDIAVLVRKNSEAKKVKDALAKRNIPATVIDDTKVTSTPTAQWLHHIMVALNQNAPSNIRRALYTPLTPKYYDPYAQPDLNPHIKLFAECREKWEAEGIFASIKKWMSYYGVHRHLLQTSKASQLNEKRIYSHLIQLLEILNNIEYFQEYTPEKLTDWLAKAIEKEVNISEYEQRMESDEAAVQIATIHKSKGLEYNIVLLPNIDLKPKKLEDFDLVTYLNSNNQKVLSIGIPNEAVSHQLEKKSRQENRRLFYVALTRAVYAAMIIKKENDDSKGMLRYFDKTKIKTRAPINMSEDKKYSPPEIQEKEFEPLSFTGDPSRQYILTSFSALDTHIHHPASITMAENTGDDYDEFIFKELVKGTKTGNFVHSIFEHIDYKDSKLHDKIITRQAKLYGIKIDKKGTKNHLLQMVDHILNTDIIVENTKLSLGQIQGSNRINELEFYFDFEQWDVRSIKEISQLISATIPHKGVMHGFIDLLFEYDGRYYILDWKTNHLGNSLDHYLPGAIHQTMVEHNYTLQYHVYTIAAIRYLQSSIKNFVYDKHFGGIIYLFVRGIRKNRNTGIFTTRPTSKTIEKLMKIVDPV